MPKSTKKTKKIYLDYASSTPIDPRAFSVFTNELKKNFANPGAIHEPGVQAKGKIRDARKKIANILFAHADEIIFTSGATESNNLAFLGVLKNIRNKIIPHIVTTNIEHSSVLEVCKFLEENNLAEITYVPVEKNGAINPRKIKKAIKSNTVLVSVMYANNEIGTIEPIREIAKEIRHFRKNSKMSRFPLLHTDATQAINYLPIKVDGLGVDLMSFNGSKIYGPKGIGVLYKKRGIPFSKIIYGGGQEAGFRPGTENLPAIMGLAEALSIAEKIKGKESERLTKLRDYFFERLESLKDTDILINGDQKNRLPNNVNITISKIPSDLLVLELSARGIYVSEKSACKSGDKKGSYVVKAIRGNNKENGSIRFSLGRQTSKKDIDFVLESLREIIKKLKKWYN